MAAVSSSSAWKRSSRFQASGLSGCSFTASTSSRAALRGWLPRSANEACAYTGSSDSGFRRLASAAFSAPVRSPAAVPSDAAVKASVVRVLAAAGRTASATTTNAAAAPSAISGPRPGRGPTGRGAGPSAPRGVAARTPSTISTASVTPGISQSQSTQMCTLHAATPASSAPANARSGPGGRARRPRTAATISSASPPSASRAPTSPVSVRNSSGTLWGWSTSSVLSR